ncbi:OVARIAN TUMOR DOMAIN-containing deubiquitinating enzyme 4, partial [Cucurbita argyrosperma subsp. sororia]
MKLRSETRANSTRQYGHCSVLISELFGYTKGLHHHEYWFNQCLHEERYPSELPCLHTDGQQHLYGAFRKNTNFMLFLWNFKTKGGCLSYCFSRRSNDFEALTVKDLITDGGSRGRGLEISLACKGMNAKISVPSDGMCSKIKYNMRWPERCASASAGLVFGWVVCCSTSEPVHAEAAHDKKGNEENNDSSHVKFSHGKKVYIDYSVIGIPGDGRCLFRSVAHGACLRSGKSAPTESLQRELADELRTKVADEFIKRREETEWFVEGDFDTYVSNMRKPHVWGGEPELFMASHVLQAPIIVYMYDKDAGGLISIAEYGDEYGKDNPIKVLYHGFGHYDALQIPANQGPAGRSKL